MHFDFLQAGLATVASPSPGPQELGCRLVAGWLARVRIVEAIDEVVAVVVVVEYWALLACTTKQPFFGIPFSTIIIMLACVIDWVN